MKNKATIIEGLRNLIQDLRNLQTAEPCRENSCAITKLEEAELWLSKQQR